MSLGIIEDVGPYWRDFHDPQEDTRMRFYNCCDDCTIEDLETKPHLRVLLEDDVDLGSLISTMHGEEGALGSECNSRYSSLSDIPHCSCFGEKLSQLPSRASYSSLVPLLSDQNSRRSSPEWSRENSPIPHRHCHLDDNHYDVLPAERGIPKSVSLPLSESVPDPFPELLRSPVINTGFVSEDSQSSPPSPVLARSNTIPSHRSPDKPEKKSLSRRHSQYLQSSYSQSWPKSKSSKDKKQKMLEFYTDDKSCKAVELEDNTKALDVCFQLILQNHVKEEKNWCLVESLSKFNLERMLEDHESVLQVFKTWGQHENNRFYFKRDFRKYEFLTRPQKFFPMSMLDIKDYHLENYELTGRAERLKNILLQNLFSGDRLPDIQGFLQVKDGKKSWKRHFFVLRKSGLYYSTKNLSKDPRHLTMFCDLNEVDIYYAQQPKKTLGAPTNFCLVLKPQRYVTDIKDLKCICVEDEASRTSWCTALRIVKYGTLLQDNHRAAMRNEDRLRSMEGRSSQQNTYVKTRVAMDFTGARSRVVTDPNEALGVAIEEGTLWSRRPGTLSRPISPSLLSSSPRSTTFQPHPLTLHLVQPWYHGNISREDAVSLIISQGCIDGLFLVRDSQSVAGAYVLSLAHSHCVKHVQIHKFESEGHIYVSLDRGHTRFSDLLQLIDFYMLNRSGLPTNLTHYVSRLP